MSRKTGRRQAEQPEPEQDGQDPDLLPARRGRGSLGTGILKIQQKHNRAGGVLCFVPIPQKAMEILEWQPGQYLDYYPTKSGELVLIRRDAMLNHFFPDYDFKASAPPVPWKQPVDKALAMRQRVKTHKSLDDAIDDLTNVYAAFDEERRVKRLADEKASRRRR